MSFPPATEMFQFAGFASPTYGFSRRSPKGWGCPIRKSGDQRVLASPPGLSQRATSFIASQCQGIHRMPLLRLITSKMRTSRRTQGQTSTKTLVEAQPNNATEPSHPREDTISPSILQPTARRQTTKARERPRFTHIHNVKQQRVEPRLGSLPCRGPEDLTLIASFRLPISVTVLVRPALAPKA
jgi:hypothetical protein